MPVKRMYNSLEEAGINTVIPEGKNNCPYFVWETPQPNTPPMEELWKPIERWMVGADILEDTYLISTYGRIYSKWNGVFMRPAVNKAGYKTVALATGVTNKSISCSVHRLVKIAFDYIPNFKELQVDHRDNNPSNNHIWNLYWCTNEQNTKWKYDRAGEEDIRKVSGKYRTEEECRELIVEYANTCKTPEDVYSLCQKYNIPNSTFIQRLVTGSWRPSVKAWYEENYGPIEMIQLIRSNNSFLVEDALYEFNLAKNQREKTEIAKRYGVTMRTLYNWAKKNNPTIHTLNNQTQNCQSPFINIPLEVFDPIVLPRGPYREIAWRAPINVIEASMEIEYWKVIEPWMYKRPIYDNTYMVSSFGRVYSLKSKRFLYSNNTNRPAQEITLQGPDGPSSIGVHYLVAVAFDYVPKYKDLQVIHIDDNLSNNHIWNLRWSNYITRRRTEASSNTNRVSSGTYKTEGECKQLVLEYQRTCFTPNDVYALCRKYDIPNTTFIQRLVTGSWRPSVKSWYESNYGPIRLVELHPQHDAKIIDQAIEDFNNSNSQREKTEIAKRYGISMRTLYNWSNGKGKCSHIGRPRK